MNVHGFGNRVECRWAQASWLDDSAGTGSIGELQKQGGRGWQDSRRQPKFGRRVVTTRATRGGAGGSPSRGVIVAAPGRDSQGTRVATARGRQSAGGGGAGQAEGAATMRAAWAAILDAPKNNVARRRGCRGAESLGLWRAVAAGRVSVPTGLGDVAWRREDLQAIEAMTSAATVPPASAAASDGQGACRLSQCLACRLSAPFSARARLVPQKQGPAGYRPRFTLPCRLAPSAHRGTVHHDGTMLRFGSVLQHACPPGSPSATAILTSHVRSTLPRFFCCH